jgi:transposase
MASARKSIPSSVPTQGVVRSHVGIQPRARRGIRAVSHLARAENRRYASLGMCYPCHARVRDRFASILRDAETERPKPAPVRDLQDVARNALTRK